MALKINSTNSGIRSGDTASESLVLPHVINPDALNPQVVAYWQGQLDPAFTATWRANRTTGYGTLIEMRGKTRGYAQDGSAANNTDVNLINPYQKNVTARVEYRYVISTNTVDVKFSYPTSYTKNDAIWILTNEVTWTGLAPDLLTESFSIFWRTTAADSVTPSYEFLINGQSAADLGGIATLSQSVVQNGPYTYVGGNPVLTTKTHTGTATNLRGYSIYWTSFGYGRSDTLDQFVVGDRVWIKGFAAGDSLPASTKFTSSSGTFAGIVKDGTLTGTSTRANVYIYDRDGSLSGTVTNRGLGGVTTGIPTTQPTITADTPSYWDWTYPTGGVFPAPYSGIYVPGRQPIIDVTVGYYITDDYVEPGYVLDDAFASLTNLSTDLGTIRGGQASIVAQSTLVVDTTFVRLVNATLFNTATVVADSEVFRGGESAVVSTATVSATANYLLNVSHTFDTVATLTAKTAETHLGQASLTTAATVTAEATRFAGGTGILEATATLTATVTTQFGATAILGAEFTTYNNGGRLIDVTEPFTYTWDELSTWSDWNSTERWSLPNGVNLVGFNTQVTLAGTQITGQATLSAQSTLTATGTHLRLAQADLAATTTLTAAGAVFKEASATLEAQTTLTTLGLRIQEIYLEAFSNAALTTAAQIVYQASADLAVDSTANILGGIRYLTPEATMTANAGTVTAISTVFSGTQAQLQAEFGITVSITVSTYERYRTFVVPQETRQLRVLAENRTLVVPEHTRIIRVPVPPLITPTIERQL